MSKRKRERPLSQLPVPEVLPAKARSPLLVVLGSPAEVVNLLSGLPGVEATCYQMDVFQAERLRAEVAARNLTANVVVGADLWDLPGEHASAIYLPARGGERALKIDMIEQSWHVLRDKGLFFVWSPYSTDAFFLPQLKKVFGKGHAPPLDKSGEPQRVLWCVREGERPRRRHEVTFQVKIGDGPSCRFVSRPGTFSYGKLDDGARALCEVMQVEPGDRVVDIGCGVGTNGVFASQLAGRNGHVAFVDSNARAVALAELNAKANGVAKFEAFASSTVEGPQEDSFDVAIANPPYFSNSSIAHLFIRRAKKLLTPQGRFFIVTKQPEELAPVIVEAFGQEDVEAVENRGHTIMMA
jgi:16S rRNA G1207 methylase RsmC